MPDESFSFTVPQPDSPPASARRIRRERKDLGIVPARARSVILDARAGAVRVAFNKVKETYSR
jgi:hypothetical protein